MQHAKPSVLSRLARLTGARILPSTDHAVAGAGGGRGVLGTCGRFRLVTYAPPSKGEGKEGEEGEGEGEEQQGQQEGDEGEGEGEGGERPSLPLEQLPPPILSPTQRARGRRPMTYAYVEGCPPALGGAVVLRGGGWEELKVGGWVVSVFFFLKDYPDKHTHTYTYIYTHTTKPPPKNET